MESVPSFHVLTKSYIILPIGSNVQTASEFNLGDKEIIKYRFFSAGLTARYRSIIAFSMTISQATKCSSCRTAASNCRQSSFWSMSRKQSALLLIREATMQHTNTTQSTQRYCLLREFLAKSSFLRFASFNKITIWITNLHGFIYLVLIQIFSGISFCGQSLHFAVEKDPRCSRAGRHLDLQKVHYLQCLIC